MAAKPKKITGVTPKGIASWPHLNTPDDYKGKKSYKVNLLLSAEDAEPLVAAIEKATEEAVAETRAKLEEAIATGKTGDVKAKAKKALASLTTSFPFSEAVDNDGDATGDYLFKFKANGEYEDKKTGLMKSIKIPLFDAKGQPTKASIWGGSTIRVSYVMAPYHVASANTCGVSLRIEGVKIIDLVSSGGARSAAAMGFGDEEEGYEDDGSDVSESSSALGELGTSDDPDDDEDF